MDPTFLICSERSGSNLIRTIVGTHSQIFSPKPLHLAQQWWSTIYRYGNLEDDANWERLLSDLAAFIPTLPGGVTVTVDELRANVKSRNFKDIYLYLNTKEMPKTKSRLFMKENHVYRHIYFLLNYFPKAKFVYQVRDPRDYLASCKKLGRRFGRLAESLQTWETDQQKSIEVLYTLTPAQVFVQRYEDLVADPEKVLRSMCKFLEVEFEPAMLKFNETEDAKKSAEASYAWRNLAKPLMSDNVAKYRQELTSMDIRMTEYHVGQLMQRFGYQPESTEFTRATKGILKVYEPIRNMLGTVLDATKPSMPEAERKARDENKKAVKNIFQSASKLTQTISYPY